MSDWNPRPDYSSQIRVDPNDDKRIYVVEYSYSDDGGKTFVHPRQSLHGDDRLVWIDPHDSKHLLKGDDGGLGVSYDRGVKWIYMTSLPVSQWYHVAVDMRKPYWVYGGLQDNGCWRGPECHVLLVRHHERRLDSYVRRADGFKTPRRSRRRHRPFIPSRSISDSSGTNSITNEERDIRPDNKRGAIQARRNMGGVGQAGAKEPELGKRNRPRPTGTVRSSCRPTTRKRSTRARIDCGKAPIAATAGRRSAT